MATRITTRRGASDPQDHDVQEPVDEVTNLVNSALSANFRFITVTGQDGKQFSIEAASVRNITEV